MDWPKASEPADEIGEIDPEVIGALVARYCPDCSPAEIVRLVLEVLGQKSLDDVG
jgi:hypothetical protein